MCWVAFRSRWCRRSGGFDLIVLDRANAGAAGSGRDRFERVQRKCLEFADVRSGDLPMCTWQLESGGDWSALNPSTRADDRYQMMPSTWAADGGTGPPQDASPAKQTLVAERIAQAQCPSAWANC